jgi:hypothetical protein
MANESSLDAAMSTRWSQRRNEDEMAKNDQTPEVSHAVRTSSKDPQKALTAFHAHVADHIAAIQTAGHEFLASHADGLGPREVRIEIAIGPDENQSRDYHSVDCWDEDVICGKSTTGYIHCKVHICMEVGPVEVLPP